MNTANTIELGREAVNTREEGAPAVMNDFADFQRSLYNPRYWELDEANAYTVFAPFEQLPPDQQRVPENAYEFGLRVAEELSR